MVEVPIVLNRKKNELEEIEAAIQIASASVDSEDFKYLADNLGLLDSVVTDERRAAYRDRPGDVLDRLRAGLL